MDKILKAKDVQNAGVAEFTERVLSRRWNAQPVPQEIAKTPIAEAEINQGRWIVPCPFCTGAEMLDPDDLRFFCLSCYNKAVGGKWIRVAVPKPEQTKEIETELMKRGNPENRNWTIKESVSDLKKENKKQGVV